MEPKLYFSIVEGCDLFVSEVLLLVVVAKRTLPTYTLVCEGMYLSLFNNELHVLAHPLMGTLCLFPSTYLLFPFKNVVEC